MRSVDRREILPQLFFDHAAVCFKIFAKCAMQSCLSFKIIFLFLLAVPVNSALLHASNSRRERCGLR